MHFGLISLRDAYGSGALPFLLFVASVAGTACTYGLAWLGMAHGPPHPYIAAAGHDSFITITLHTTITAY